MLFYQQDPKLRQIAWPILETVWQQFPELDQKQMALTWLVYDDSSPRGFHYRGGDVFYPASIVKLFYLVAVQQC